MDWTWLLSCLSSSVSVAACYRSSQCLVVCLDVAPECFMLIFSVYSWYVSVSKIFLLGECSVAHKITSQTLLLNYKTLNQTKYIFSVNEHSLIGTQKFTLTLHTLTTILSKVMLHVKMQKNHKVFSQYAKPILVCLMANAHYKTQTYRPTDNA